MAKAYSTSILESPSGASLALYTRALKKKPKAVVHITHGMSEHGARYERFADYLAKAGYYVVAHDHRGHGKTVSPDAPLGAFSDKDGWPKVMEDIIAVNDHIRETVPDTPIVYFGHSMGSIIGLNFCIHHSDRIDAAALWNSGVDGGALLVIYSGLLAVERMMKGSDVPSTVANKLAFDAWNKKFAPNRTQSDWLSRDEAEVDKYINDQFCGFDATNGLWRDLIIGIRTGASDRELARIRKDLPVHLLAGGQDPCSDQGKAVERVYDRMKKVGITDVTYKLYPENRHEALNELNRDTVMAEFVAWLDARFGS